MCCVIGPICFVQRGECVSVCVCVCSLGSFSGLWLRGERVIHLLGERGAD